MVEVGCTRLFKMSLNSNAKIGYFVRNGDELPENNWLNDFLFTYQVLGKLTFLYPPDFEEQHLYV